MSRVGMYKSENNEVTWEYDPMMAKTKDEYLYHLRNIIVSEINAQHSVPNHRLVMALNVCDEALNK